jgi:FKBP-type peptidyl-prolyl cis-trans isomerase SlyD
MNQKVITIEYDLYKDTADGEMIESTKGKDPLVFLSGSGQMIPDFESNVSDLEVGESFSFSIATENAYGKRKEEAIIELAQDMFMKDGVLMKEVVVGSVLPLQDQNGHLHPSKVMSINDTTIKLDVNHPLADQNLYFTGKVIDVRKPTSEEIDHGHVHGEGGHQH